MKRENVEAIYPLLPNHEAFWLAHLHTEKDPGCLQAVYRLEGNVELPIFEHALQTVFDQHAMLRATIQRRPEKTPLMVVWKKAKPFLQFHDIRDRDDAQQQALIELCKRDELKKGIDPSELPPCRFQLFQVGETRHELLWTFHHIFVDGWSTSLAVRDVLIQYDRISSKQSPEPLLADGKEYMSWRKSTCAQSQQDFWNGQLQGYRGVPRVFNAASRFGGSQRKTETKIHIAGSESTARLEALKKTYQLTTGSIAAGIWALSLGKIYARNDIAFGVTVSGRSIPLDYAQDMVGLFANVVPLRQQINSDENMASFLTSLRDRQFEIQEWEHTPLGELSMTQKIEREHILFETLLVIENYPAFQSQGNIKLLNFDSGLSTAYPLTICVIPSRDWSVKAVYDPDAVDSILAEAIVQQFVTCLQTLSDSIDGSTEAFQSGMSNFGQTAEPSVNVVAISDTGDQSDVNVQGSIGAPRNETELQLTMIWERILGLNEVRYDDDFFEIGGNSLVASRMIAAIKSSFGQTLSPSSLIEHPTIETLAQILESGESGYGNGSSIVVRFNRCNQGRPLICVNVGDEPVMFYRHLAAHFDDRPTLGTQSRGLFRFERPFSSVEQAASCLVDEIDRNFSVNDISSEESWDLVAYCAGSSVAFEMARQLEASDRRPGSLTIIDSGLKYPVPAGTLSYFREKHSTVFNWLPEYARHHYRRKIRQPLGRLVRPLLAQYAPTESIRQKFRRGYVRAKTMSAYFAYEAGRIATPMMLIRSSEYVANPEKDFHIELQNNSAENELCIKEVDGNHETILLEPTVAMVAQHVRAFLEKCAVAKREGEQESSDIHM